MRTVCKILITIVLLSCNPGFDINKAEWKNVEGLSMWQFCVERNGDAPNNGLKKINLRFYGFDVNGKITPDSATPFPEIALLYLSSVFENNTSFKGLSPNTIGYCRADLSDALSLSTPIHFSIYYKGDPDAMQLSADSSYLSSLGVFRSIRVIDKKKAAALWGEGNDTSWMNILEDIPFPASMDLQLEKGSLKQRNVDSVETLLKEKFSSHMVERRIKTYLPPDIDPANAKPVFKFVVL